MMIQKSDFVKSFSLTLFEIYFTYSLGALSTCHAFFEFLCGTFVSQNFYKFTYSLGRQSFDFPKFTKICPFLFTLHAC